MDSQHPRIDMPADSKFPLGRLVMTSAALDSIPIQEMIEGVRLHSKGEWGDLDEHDRAVNETALIDGTRLLSAYQFESGNRFYVITEWDRTVSTVLLPEDY